MPACTSAPNASVWIIEGANSTASSSPLVLPTIANVSENAPLSSASILSASSILIGELASVPFTIRCKAAYIPSKAERRFSIASITTL